MVTVTWTVTWSWLWGIIPIYLAGWVLCARWIHSANDGGKDDVPRPAIGILAILWPLWLLIGGIYGLLILPTLGCKMPLVARANYKRAAPPSGPPLTGLPPGRAAPVKRVKGPNQ